MIVCTFDNYSVDTLCKLSELISNWIPLMVKKDRVLKDTATAEYVY